MWLCQRGQIFAFRLDAMLSLPSRRGRNYLAGGETTFSKENYTFTMAWTRDRIIFSSNIIRSLLLFRDYSIRDREDLSTRMNREEKLALLNF